MALIATEDDGESWTILDDETGTETKAHKSDWNGQLPYGVTASAPLLGAGQASKGPPALAGTPPLDASVDAVMPNDYVGGKGETGPMLRSTQTGMTRTMPDAVSSAGEQGSSIKVEQLNPPDVVSGDTSLGVSRAAPPSSTPVPPFASVIAPQPSMSTPGTGASPSDIEAARVSSGSSQSSSGSGKVSQGGGHSKSGMSAVWDARDKELQDVAKKSIIEKSDSDVAAAEAQAQGNDASAALIESQRARDEADKPAQEAREKARQARQDSDEKSWRDSLTDFENAKVDPDSYWNSRTTGQKLAAEVSIALSGFSNGSMNAAQIYAGGVPTKLANDGMDRLEKTIDRDIQLQKEAIDKKGKVAAGKKTLLDFTRDKISDERAAEDAAKALAWKNVARDGDAIALRAGSATTRAQAAGLAAAARAKAAEYEASMRQQMRENQQKEADRAYHYAVLAEEKRHNKKAEEAASAKSGDDGYTVYGPSGNPIAHFSKQDKTRADRAQVISEGQGRMNALLPQVREKFKNGWAAPGTKERAEQDALNFSWVNAAKNSDGDTSAPNKEDFEARGLSGKTNPLARIDTSYAAARQGAAAALKTLAVPDDVLVNEGFIEPPDAALGKTSGETLIPPTLDTNRDVATLDTSTGDIYVLSPEGFKDVSTRYPHRYRQASLEELKKSNEGAHEEAEKKQLMSGKAVDSDGNAKPIPAGRRPLW